jgi:hypothetical protein
MRAHAQPLKSEFSSEFSMKRSTMRVLPACEEDIPAWLILANEVEALFGVPLSVDEGFQQALLRNIQLRMWI